MDELREMLARLKEDAAKCDAISERAIDPNDRDRLAYLAANLRKMIAEAERVIGIAGSAGHVDPKPGGRASEGRLGEA